MIDNSSFENTSELDSTTMKADQRHSLEGMMGMGVASTFHAILMQSSPKIFQVKSLVTPEKKKKTQSFNYMVLKVCFQREQIWATNKKDFSGTYYLVLKTDSA